MGRPLRMYEKDEVYFVTARAFQARMLLRPSAEVNDLVGGVLARAVAMYGVEIYSYVFASNHVHLLLRARDGKLSSFMQYLLANVARKVGRLRKWTGAFWERRFSAEPVLDDGAFLSRLRYVLAHGVKEGLVKRVAEWPGLSSLPQLLGAGRRTFRWFHWQRRWIKGRRLKDGGEQLLSDAWAEQVELELTPPPPWARLSPEERVAAVQSLVQEIEEEGQQHHRTVLGREAILAQSPTMRPVRPKRAPRPLCHASVKELRRAFLDKYRAFVAAYRGASERFRRGDLTAVFPPLSFLPPGLCGPGA